MSPWRAPRPCRVVGCPALVTGSPGLCSAHRLAAERARRAKTGDLYATPRWRAFRAWYLAGHPLCVTCRDLGSHVDHRVRLTADNLDTALDPDAVQTLCARCHGRKTWSETLGPQRGMGSTKGTARPANYLPGPELKFAGNWRKKEAKRER
jgi:5-methylcytosine-specific restriction protein A